VSVVDTIVGGVIGFLSAAAAPFVRDYLKSAKLRVVDLFAF